jgi:hypothetical protein
MNILGYGEDALTLWAISKKLPVLLEKLGDNSLESECQIFLRPSFGRRGGHNSSQFGEFDFILLSRQNLYLGESKWNRSSEKIENGVIHLRPEQLFRHKLFKSYVREWFRRKYADWGEFSDSVGKFNFEGYETEKPVAPKNSLLALNLQTILEEVDKQFGEFPAIKNVLLYFHAETPQSELPQEADGDFELILIDYSDDLFDNFIRL